MVRMTIRVPETIKNWLSGRAEQNSRSINGEVVAIFKDAKDKDKKEEKQPENQ
jgi:hypothetical protein